jgi:antitoxin component of MazEF toxin-antitoxin module
MIIKSLKTWGNSKCIPMPKELLDILGIEDCYTYEVHGNKLIIQAVNADTNDKANKKEV